ncbi:MAG: hypothetical protein K2P84_14335, partial [Undibacterium sp.]|nr:hypothetical protein [Undibacterium sp.]
MNYANRIVLLIGLYYLFARSMSACAAGIEEVKYVGIEISGSGQKAFLYQRGKTNIVEELQKISSQDKMRAQSFESRNVGMASALSENMIPKKDILSIANNVAELFQIAVEVHKVAPQNIYIVGSSALEKSRNSGELFVMLRKQILSLKLSSAREFVAMLERENDAHISFLGAHQEGVFSLLDAIDSLGSNSGKNIERKNSILIDIGAGNTKLAYLVPNKAGTKWVPYTYEIPYGTDTLAKRLSTSNDPKCHLGLAVELCDDVLSEAAFENFKTSMPSTAPRFFETTSGDYKNIVVVGGTSWAVARITHLADMCDPFTSINLRDVLSAQRRSNQLETTLSAQRITGKETCNVSEDVQKLLKTYSRKSSELKSGILLLQWILETMSDKASSSLPSIRQSEAR